MMTAAKAERVARIARAKGWDKAALLEILFVQGHGRKSLDLVWTLVEA
tara:strand:- start:1621 stop:1764 length:144 start_codon:yes stop_codon:yes gene_type:complete